MEVDEDVESHGRATKEEGEARGPSSQGLRSRPIYLLRRTRLECLGKKNMYRYTLKYRGSWKVIT